MARMRTFIGVTLDDKVRTKLLAIQEKLALSCDSVKWVETENLHVTLLFLGEVDDRDIVDVCRVVAECAVSVPRFRLTVEQVGCFGNPRRPRTLWAGIGEGAEELVTLHTLLEPPLLELGCYRREERSYTPHITLGRVKMEEEQDELAAQLQKLKGWQGGHTQVLEILVMSSELTRSGPTYTVLSRAKLGKPAE